MCLDCDIKGITHQAAENVAEEIVSELINSLSRLQIAHIEKSKVLIVTTNHREDLEELRIMMDEAIKITASKLLMRKEEVHNLLRGLPTLAVKDGASVVGIVATIAAQRADLIIQYGSFTDKMADALVEMSKIFKSGDPGEFSYRI